MRSKMFLLTLFLLNPLLLNAQPFTEAEAFHLDSFLELQYQFPSNELSVGTQLFVNQGDGYAKWFETVFLPGIPSRREIQNPRESHLFDVESSHTLPHWQTSIRLLEFVLLPAQSSPTALALTGEHSLITLARKTRTSQRHIANDFLLYRGLLPEKWQKMRIEHIFTVNTDVYFVARNFHSAAATTGISLDGTTMEIYRCPNDPSLSCYSLSSIETIVKKIVKKHFRNRTNEGIQSIQIRKANEISILRTRDLSSPVVEIWVQGNDQVLFIPLTQILLYEALSIENPEQMSGDSEAQALFKKALRFVGNLNGVYRPFPPGTSKETMRKETKRAVEDSAFIVNKKDLLMPWLLETTGSACTSELSGTTR